MVEKREPQDSLDDVEPVQDFTAAKVMLDHHHQTRFTLVWAAQQEKAQMRELVVRSVFATFRGRPPRSEPDGGFQLHEVTADGVAYIKILWVDGRESKLRALRYQIFEEFKRAVCAQRLACATSFQFQLDSTLQGLPQQAISGRDVPFELAFDGSLDQLGQWIQQV